MVGSLKYSRVRRWPVAPRRLCAFHRCSGCAGQRSHGWHRGGAGCAAVCGAVPGFFMKEEGHRLHRGFQQAQRERRPEIARDGIGHDGRHADVNHVVAAGFHQHGLVVACSLANAGHGGLLVAAMPAQVGDRRDQMIIILN